MVNVCVIYMITYRCCIHTSDTVGIFLFSSCGLSKQQDILWWNIRTKLDLQISWMSRATCVGQDTVMAETFSIQ